jgi:hypothetical protein
VRCGEGKWHPEECGLKRLHAHENKMKNHDEQETIPPLAVFTVLVSLSCKFMPCGSRGTSEGGHEQTNVFGVEYGNLKILKPYWMGKGKGHPE